MRKLRLLFFLLLLAALQLFPQSASGLTETVRAPRPVTQEFPYRDPSVVSRDGVHIYTTSFGKYTFAGPVFNYSDWTGRALLTASAFWVNSTVVLIPGTSVVETADNLRLQVSTEVKNLALTVVGSLTVSVSFFRDRPPKFTAEFTGTLETFNIVWALVTVDKFYRSSSTSTVDFSSSLTLSRQGTGFQAEVGGSTDLTAWTYKTVADWSDFGAAIVHTGRVIAPNILGQGILVSFPQNVASLDPSTVTTTTVSEAGFGGPWARQAFYAVNRYWVFFLKSVVCEVGIGNFCIHYATSSDAVTWQTYNLNVIAKTTAFSPETMGYFSILNDGTNVYYGRANATTTAFENVLFRQGSLSSDGTIAWNSEIQVVANATGNQRFVGLSLGKSSTGQMFLAYNTGTSSLRVSRSTGTDYTAWTEDTVDACGCYKKVLVPMGAGKMYLAATASLDSPGDNLSGFQWDGSWGSAEDVSNGVNVMEPFLFSSSDRLTAFWQTSSAVQAREKKDGVWGTVDTVRSATFCITTRISCWTVTREALTGNFYLFHFDQTGGAIKQYKGVLGDWDAGTTVFATGTSDADNGITSFASSVQSIPIENGPLVIGVFWTESASSPYTIKAGVVSIEVPVVPNPPPTGGGGGPSLPFNVTSNPVAEVVLAATKFVLQWPVTGALVGITLFTASISHVKKRRVTRDISVIGLAVVAANWVIANNTRLFGRYDISFLAPYAIREPPLTLTLFGYSSSVLAFFLIMTFIGSIGMVTAVLMALRD